MFISMKTASLRKSSVVRAFLLIAALLVSAGSAWALEVEAAKIPALKKYDFVPEAQFDAQTKAVNETSPYGDDELSYSLRLPKGWTENTQATLMGSSSGEGVLSSDVLSIIGRYTSPAKNFKRSYVTVEAIHAAYEIGMKDWFFNFMIRSGFTISAMSEKSLREIEALYIQNEGEDAYVVRARLILNGSKIVLVRYFLPQDNYDDEKIEQAQIIDSFKFLSDAGTQIEKRETYGFLDQSYFDFPASWELKERSILTIERMSATISQIRVIGDDKTNEGDREYVLQGFIKVVAVSKLLKTTLPQEIERFRSEIKIPGHKIGKMVGQLSFDFHPDIVSGKGQIYALTPDAAVRTKDYQLAVSVLEGKDYYYITSLVTPSKAQDFYIWARNMQAYRIVNETIRRGNVPVPDASDPYFDYLKDAQ